MCFTINIHTSRDAIEKRFNVETSALTDFEYRYFYRAFDKPALPVICQEVPEKISLLNWGLIPHWVSSAEQAENIRKKTYNARCESLSEKPSFNIPVERQRCLVVANGFYEWQHIAKQRIPWYIKSENNQLFAFAGLYDKWYNPESEKEEKSFSIITCKANPLMEKIHNTKKRMPVILNQKNESEWLNPKTPLDQALKLLLPAPEKTISAYTVKPGITDKNINPNDSSIIEPYVYFTSGKLF